MDFNIRKPGHVLALFVLLFSFFLIFSPVLSFLGFLETVNEAQISEQMVVAGSVLTILMFVGVPVTWYKLVNGFDFKKILSTLMLKTSGFYNALTWGFLVAAVMYVVVLAAGSLLIYYGMEASDLSNIEDLARVVSFQPLLFIVVFQSFSEEVFFRGFLLEKINGLTNRGSAVILTALFFGVAHMAYGKIYTVVMTLVMGLILGYIVLKTRNLFSSVTAHLVFNLTGFMFYYFAKIV